ncbi:MAG: acyl-CoA dehydratase activase [Thermodesulfobacteriota bacterium]|nr:acyl-CoA dehydratase activase [Thermodesulfobacteriota bacterium]
MRVAGCDIGSLTAKAVIMEEENILSEAIIQSQTKPSASAEEVIDLALDRAGLSRDDIQYAVGTGYGKDLIPFVQRVESEISCHAKGAWWSTPSVRTVIDIGGQDAKVIRVDETGKVIRFIYNDKCASGTGRFLEIMADALEVNIEEMGSLGKQSGEIITISNQCVIFAETEVVSLINKGRDIPDIINGLHHAMTGRVASLAKSIGVEEDVVLAGGVAKNIGVFDALAESLDLPVRTLNGIDPQINGAVGAALFAMEYIKGNSLAF